MADHPFADIVKHATGLPAAMAADLAVAGGILRCGTCKQEEPLGDIASHLTRGWPKCCGLTMTWLSLRTLAAERWEVPADCELVAVADDGDWQLDDSRHCRRQGPGHVTCGEPSVISLRRGRSGLWGYCISHTFGRWIEDGRVMHWILREKSADDAPPA